MTQRADPALHAAAVVTSDTAIINPHATALYIGGAGDVTLVTEGGDQVTLKAVPVGTVLPVRTKKVMATGTTATNIVALRSE